MHLGHQSHRRHAKHEGYERIPLHVKNLKEYSETRFWMKGAQIEKFSHGKLNQGIHNTCAYKWHNGNHQATGRKSAEYKSESEGSKLSTPLAFTYHACARHTHKASREHEEWSQSIKTQEISQNPPK